uniref:Arl_C13 protein n=1 Tax=Paramecium tetraurelia TaxID=5888 RepID=Q3SDP2_PARTE|nr:arl_C13 [Paramecium tetraurelia]
MGCLSSSQKEEDVSIALQSQKKLKIVFIGLEGSGKTAILQYLRNGKFTETQPTIGLNVETIQYKQRFYLIFDVGGKVRTLWSHYYDNLDGLVFVVDKIQKELKKLSEDIKTKVINQLIQIVLLMYLNKSDLQNSQTMEFGDIPYSKSDVIIQKCSAKSGEGIWEGIDKMNGLLDQKFQS